MTTHSSLLDFDILEQIGKGTFGVVYKCKRKKDGGIYVLKELRLTGASGDEVEAAINECNILASIDSDYVIRYYDSFIDNSTETLWLVMEYAQHGTLRDIIIKEKDYMPEADAWYYITEMIIGIASLHALHIIHRDIKSLNIFVTAGTSGEEFTLKIGDMGVSKQLNSTTFMSQTLVGSPYYLSPEICKSEKYNVKSDIWALGVTFYEMLNKGKHPFLAKNQAALLINIIKGKYPPLPAVYSTELIDVVRWCLQLDPAKRPDIFSLLAIKPIEKIIEQYSLHVPKYVEDGAREALQRLERIKSAEISRSRMESERSSKTPSSMPRDSAAPPSRPVISEREETVKSVEPVSVQQQTIIESDVIVVDTDEIHEYQDDFDDEQPETQRAVFPGSRPDTSRVEAKLNELLNDDRYLLSKFEDCVKEITSFQLTQEVKDELIDFFMRNTNPSQEEISDFVFKLIPHNKIGIINHLKQYAELMREREKLEDEINKVMGEIHG